MTIMVWINSEIWLSIDCWICVRMLYFILLFSKRFVRQASSLETFRYWMGDERSLPWMERRLIPVRVLRVRFTFLALSTNTQRPTMWKRCIDISARRLERYLHQFIQFLFGSILSTPNWGEPVSLNGFRWVGPSAFGRWAVTLTFYPNNGIQGEPTGK